MSFFKSARDLAEDVHMSPSFNESQSAGNSSSARLVRLCLGNSEHADLMGEVKVR